MTAVSYHILGLEPGAQIIDVKKAYRAKAKAFHPDINTTPEAPESFIRIKQAYDNIIKGTGHGKAGQAAYYQYYRRREQYKRYGNTAWPPGSGRYNAKRKEVIDFRATSFGRSVYFIFFIVFLIAGLYLAISPVFSLFQPTVDIERNMAVAIPVAILASVFGVIMVLTLLLTTFTNRLRRYAL